MTVDYYSLLTKAVAGKDAVARDQIYKDAFSLITRSHLTREAASSHAAALEDAVRRIEDDIAAEEANSAAANQRSVVDGQELEALAIGAGAVARRHRPVGFGLRLCRNQRPRIVAASVKAPSPKAQRGREDVVMADLKPGVDGGSSRRRSCRLRCSGRWCFTAPPSCPVRSWSIGKTAFSI